MASSHSGTFIVFVCLSAAWTMVSAQAPRVDLPVTRLSGDAPPQSPTQPSKPPSTQVPGLPVTQLDERVRSADLDAPQRLTLSFSQPADVREVLLLLVRGTPLSIAMDPGIKGRFVGELKDVTLRQAIESVLAPNGLAFDLHGPVIRVFPRRTETRLYDLNFLNLDRSWQRSVKGDDETVLASRMQADALDLAASGIRSLLSSAGGVHVDRHAGLAQVTDFADRLDRVGAYVEALHLRESRQVRLQARVLEVTLRDGQAIDWRGVRARLGLSEKALTAGTVVDPAALQAALAAQGDVQVIAAPELVAINNEPAVVRTTTDGISAFTLTVIPQISSDGIVQLSVSPSWSLGQATRSGGAADTIVRVMDGSTVMVSGLLHAVDRTYAAREIVVLLTPTVVNAGAGMAGAR